MPQVTVSPVNLNNLKTSLSVHLSVYTSALAHYSISISSVLHCKTSQPTTKATGTKGSCLSVLGYIHMRGEMNSNQYEISFQLKISVQCSVSSLHVNFQMN